MASETTIPPPGPIDFHTPLPKVTFDPVARTKPTRHTFLILLNSEGNPPFRTFSPESRCFAKMPIPNPGISSWIGLMVRR